MVDFISIVSFLLIPVGLIALFLCTFLFYSKVLKPLIRWAFSCKGQSTEDRDEKRDGFTKTRDVTIKNMIAKGRAFLNRKPVQCAVRILAAIVLFFSVGLKLPVIDTSADTYFREGISLSMGAYATCRMVNASVSVIKDSNVDVAPAGVGLSLGLGQVLDPIDDMTERLSDVLVTAITSLGVQKLAYEISVSLAPPVISALLFISAVLMWFKHERIFRLEAATKRLLFLIVVARLCLPLSSMVNNFLQKEFFDDRIAYSKKELAVASTGIEKLKDFSIPEIDGFMGTLENSASFLKQRSIDLKDAVVMTIKNADNIIENLLELTFLYVGVFLIQVILLPLLIFWGLAKKVNSIFETNIPAIFHEPQKIQATNAQ